MTVPGDEQMFIRFLRDLERVVFTNVVMISMPALLIRLVQIIYSGLCIDLALAPSMPMHAKLVGLSAAAMHVHSVPVRACPPVSAHVLRRPAPGRGAMASALSPASAAPPSRSTFSVVTSLRSVAFCRRIACRHIHAQLISVCIEVWLCTTTQHTHPVHRHTHTHAHTRACTRTRSHVCTYSFIHYIHTSRTST